MYKKVLVNRFVWQTNGILLGMDDPTEIELQIHSNPFNFNNTTQPQPVITDLNNENIVAIQTTEGLLITNRFAMQSMDPFHGGPKDIVVYLAGGKSFVLEKEKYVILKNYATSENTENDINYYKYMINCINTALETHIKGSELRTVITASTPQEQALLKKALGHLAGVVVVNKPSSVNVDPTYKIEQFDIRTEYDKLQQLKNALQINLLERIGISFDSNQTNKQPVDILQGSQMQQMLLDYELNLRKKFCQKIKSKFGFNITVSLNPKLDLTPVLDTKYTKGVENGKTSD